MALYLREATYFATFAMKNFDNLGFAMRREVGLSVVKPANRFGGFLGGPIGHELFVVKLCEELKSRLRLLSLSAHANR